MKYEKVHTFLGSKSKQTYTGKGFLQQYQLSFSTNQKRPHNFPHIGPILTTIALGLHTQSVSSVLYFAYRADCPDRIYPSKT